MKKILLLIPFIAISLNACHSKADEYAEQQMEMEKARTEAHQKQQQSQRDYINSYRQRWGKPANNEANSK